MKYDVFISYSRKDKDTVDKICKVFDKNNISYFIGRNEIESVAEYVKVLADFIDNCEIFLFIGSKNAYQSMFTNKEVAYTSIRKNDKNRLLYIIDNSELPKEFERIFSTINHRTISEHPIDTVLVEDILKILGRDSSIEAENNTTINENEDIYPIPWEKDEKYGFIDKTGKLVIPCQWKLVKNFKNGVAKVEDENYKTHLIDKQGNIII